MDPSVKTARFGELWHAWPRVGRTELAKSLGGKVRGSPRRSRERQSLPPLSFSPPFSYVLCFVCAPSKLHVQVGELVEQHDDDSPIRLSSAFNHTGETGALEGGKERKKCVWGGGDDTRSFCCSTASFPAHGEPGDTDKPSI